MGQIKNIKLHIVTDIKVSISLNKMTVSDDPEAATRKGEDTFDTSVVPTVPDVVQRIKPSRSSSSETSSRLPLFVICRRRVFSMGTLCQSCMLNLLTASVVQSI